MRYHRRKLDAFSNYIRAGRGDWSAESARDPIDNGSSSGNRSGNRNSSPAAPPCHALAPPTKTQRPCTLMPDPLAAKSLQRVPVACIISSPASLSDVVIAAAVLVLHIPYRHPIQVFSLDLCPIPGFNPRVKRRSALFTHEFHEPLLNCKSAFCICDRLLLFALIT